MSKYSKYSKTFKVLSDSKRLWILDILKTEELCATDIINIVMIPQSALSYHMKILYEYELVNIRKDGKKTYYRLNNCKCTEALDYLNLLTENFK